MPSSSKPTSKSVDELIKNIHELPPDLSRELLYKIKTMSLHEITPSLPLVSKEFSRIYPDINLKKLQTIKVSSPHNTLQKVVQRIGKVTIKDLNRNEALTTVINNIFYNELKAKESPEHNEFYPFVDIRHYNTLESSKAAYLKATGKNDFDKKLKSYEEQIVALRAVPDDLNYIKSLCLHKGSTQYINALDYDRPNYTNAKKKIDEFLKLNSKNTYSEFVNALTALPTGAKLSL
jgi:hypothetical protein